MIMSGALHGSGEDSWSSAHTTSCNQGYSFGTGWNGIAVALIAKNNPWASSRRAAVRVSRAGAKAAMLNGDVTFEIASIAQSFIFYFVTAQAFYGLAPQEKGSMRHSQFAIPIVYNAVEIVDPFLLAAIGGLFTELSGMLNIALEGLILTGAFFERRLCRGQTGSLFLGILLGVLCSMLLALLFGAMIYLRANVFITGLATNLFASGFTIVLAFQMFHAEGNIQLQHPRLPSLNVPEFLQRIPFVGDILFGHNIIVYITWIIVVIATIVIYRTPFGMRLRGTA